MGFRPLVDEPSKPFVTKHGTILAILPAHSGTADEILVRWDDGELEDLCVSHGRHVRGSDESRHWPIFPQERISHIGVITVRVRGATMSLVCSHGLFEVVVGKCERVGYWIPENAMVN